MIAVTYFMPNTDAVRALLYALLAVAAAVVMFPVMVAVMPSDLTEVINARLQRQAEYQTEFNAGRDAFQRGEFPKADWSKPKQAGWDFAGEVSYLAACENDSIGVEETFSPWR